MKKFLVLPGDGIGREVCEAALPVLDLLNLPIQCEFGEIGWDFWCQEGNAIPAATWHQIDMADAVLLGAISSKGKQAAEAELVPALQGRGLRYTSPVLQLRQRLELFANVRPVWRLAGQGMPFRCAIIRENTEGLYAGFDRQGVPESLSDWLTHPNLARSGLDQAAISVRLQTRFGLERLFRYAFDYAGANGYSRVTLADKPNVLRESGQFATDIFLGIAAHYAGIEAEICNVDAVALNLVRQPQRFGVIVAENLLGDILSDLAAGVMGGLGLAPSANIGHGRAYFEPVHGSAPDISGSGRANPAAMFLTIGMALRHMGFAAAADRIDGAVLQVVRQGRCLTPDLGGTSNTQDMASAILQAVTRPRHALRASIVCVGEELLVGRVLNSNAAEIGRRLSEAGYVVTSQHTCPDRLPAIQQALADGLGQSDLVVVNGGLGPTPDDLTRHAVAAVLQRSLEFDATTMANIETRMTGYGLKMDPSNRVQALFPQGSRILANPNGTAAGFELDWQACRLLVLPGPPRESLPMLDRVLAAAPRHPAAPSYCWTLLGVVESDIAAIVGRILAEYGAAVDVSYLWRYPYVDVRLSVFDERAAPCVIELERRFAAHLVSRDGVSAMTQLLPLLAGRRWLIDDGITQHTFTNRLPASNDTSALDVVRMKALANRPLAAPWEGVLSMSCQVQIGARQGKYRLDVPHRGPEVLEYACEFLAWSILRNLDAFLVSLKSEPCL